MSILVVGSVAFDVLKTPTKEADRVLGGAATYFALAASYFTPVNVVAVVGAPDDRWGQHVLAYVVADEGVTAEELDTYCLASDRLARFKRPREYRFVSELPKSPAGKILRRMLRDE